MTISLARPPIKTATTLDADAVNATLALAFSADPVMRWAYPEAHTFLAHWDAFVRAFGGRAFEHGTAHCLEGYAGAALWLPPDVQPDEEALVGLLQRSLPAERLGEGFGLLEQMGGYHPDGPHWYLPLIGVDPIYQGRGYGSALLEHALAVCDRDQLPAYLESSNPRNIPLYERHGFEAVGAIQVGTSPTIIPMLRRPQGR